MYRAVTWFAGDAGYQYPAVACGVPAACLQDPPPHFPRPPFNRQVSPLHLHHEHCQYSRHCGHHQLELPRAPHSLDAQLDTGRLYQGTVTTCLIAYIERTRQVRRNVDLVAQYLPIFLFMRRPKKTRLRWMMEMQGQSSHTRRLPPPTSG